MREILGWSTTESIEEGAIEAAHRSETAFEGAIGNAVLLFVHKNDGIFKLDYGQIFVQRDAAFVLEIS